MCKGGFLFKLYSMRKHILKTLTLTFLLFVTYSSNSYADTGPYSGAETGDCVTISGQEYTLTDYDALFDFGYCTTTTSGDRHQYKIKNNQITYGDYAAHLNCQSPKISLFEKWNYTTGCESEPSDDCQGLLDICDQTTCADYGGSHSSSTCVEGDPPNVNCVCNNDYCLEQAAELQAQCQAQGKTATGFECVDGVVIDPGQCLDEDPPPPNDPPQTSLGECLQVQDSIGGTHWVKIDSYRGAVGPRCFDGDLPFNTYINWTYPSGTRAVAYYHVSASCEENLAEGYECSDVEGYSPDARCGVRHEYVGDYGVRYDTREECEGEPQPEDPPEDPPANNSIEGYLREIIRNQDEQTADTQSISDYLSGGQLSSEIVGGISSEIEGSTNHIGGKIDETNDRLAGIESALTDDSGVGNKVGGMSSLMPDVPGFNSDVNTGDDFSGRDDAPGLASGAAGDDFADIQGDLDAGLSPFSGTLTVENPNACLSGTIMRTPVSVCFDEPWMLQVYAAMKVVLISIGYIQTAILINRGIAS